MQKLSQIKKFFRNLVMVTGFAIISACNTSPSMPSSASSPGSPGSSTPSSSAPPGTPTASTQSGSGSGDQSSPQTTPSKAGADSEASTSQTGTGEEGLDKSQTSPDAQQGDKQKTDDQILADALDEFDKKIKSEQQDAMSDSSGSQPQPADSADKGPGTLTQAEKSRQLNSQLDNKFSKFDDMLLSEREALANEGYEGGSGNSNLDTGFGEGEDDSQEKPLQTAMIDGDATSSKNKSSAGSPTSSNIPPPADIGTGESDDIIARQLREAAMKEQDPVLRKKLWDEYRKYKRGASQAKR